MKQAVSYGCVVFGAVFFVGWVTGLGGSLLPNLGFSLLMGALAAGLYFVMRARFGSDDNSRS